MSKILLIEDDQLIRELYERQLNKAGFETTAIASGSEGLKAFENGIFDLVLLDIMLPDLSGIEILKEINNKNLTHKAPIVLLTNLANDSVIKDGMKLGIVGYLIKAQITPKDLIAEVNRFLTDKNLTPGQ